MRITGSIRLLARPLDGRPSAVLLEKRNLIVDQSADAIARMADPTSNYAVRYMYFEFSNSSPDPSDPGTGDTAADYGSIEAPGDYLRVPILAGPALSVTPGEEARYSGNAITFFATTGSAPLTGGIPLGEVNQEAFGPGSKVCAAGLVVSDGQRRNDLLHSRTLVSPVFSKTADYEFDLHWTLVFDNDAPIST